MRRMGSEKEGENKMNGEWKRRKKIGLGVEGKGNIGMGLGSRRDRK